MYKYDVREDNKYRTQGYNIVLWVRWPETMKDF